MYNNKSHLIRLWECLKDLDSQVSQLDLNRHNRTGLKLKRSPLCPVLERTILKGVVTGDNSPPLNRPHLPQSSESQPFPLPILLRPDIPVGGRLAHFVGQWGESTNNKWVLCIVWDSFRIPFRSTSPLLSVPISLSQSSSPVLREENFSRNGQWKGYKIWEHPLFIPGYFLFQKRTENYVW